MEETWESEKKKFQGSKTKIIEKLKGIKKQQTTHNQIKSNYMHTGNFDTPGYFCNLLQLKFTWKFARKCQFS